MKLLVFTAQWCGPCQKFKPVLQQLNQEIPEIEIEYIDVDANPTSAQKYKIRTLPTTVIVTQEQEVNRLVGLKDINSLRKSINI